MVNFSLGEKLVERHPWFSFEELATALGLTAGLTENLEFEVKEKISLFSKGRARKGKDFKYLTGYSEHNLFELRWDVPVGPSIVKLRLIGCDTGLKLLLLAWHVKDTSLPSDLQRLQMNLACEFALERMKSIE